MGKRIAVILLIGIVVGWAARWLFDSDACYDAGGYWESRGSYCYGARLAHRGAESAHP